MKKLLASLTLFAAMTIPAIAHADPIVYDFYLVQQGLGPDDVPYLISENLFSLTDGQSPDKVFPPYFESDNDEEYALAYFNVGTIGEVFFGTGEGDLGITLIDCTGCSGPFHVSAGPLWTGDPYHPTFLPGIYKSPIQIPNYIEIVAEQTPEPSTFALLGTGALGLLGIAKRRFSR